MDTITIEGWVLPEIRRVSIPDIDSISFKDPNGFEGIFKFKIRDGNVHVECDIVSSCDNALQFCTVRSLELATALVDIFAFSKGWALSVIVDFMTRGEERRPIALSEQSVQAYCNAFQSAAEFQQLSNLVLPNLSLRFAFRDLVSSLSTLNYSAIAAARAVEVIRSQMASDTSESQAWEVMRNKLRIERSYLKFITDASRYPRHGNRGATDGGTQIVVTHRAWAIMTRYLEFLKRGGKEELPEDMFPLLTA
ncbi:hypothetical protein P3C58_16300 [Mesorhizobium sp. XAP10]|uniref:hypothetical protein n=1 Tax=unclassified Mesorhizobium TaxID=325217 RepID=UPI0023DEC34A|nr:MULTISPECIES: hypothetical protein [unclassified Mesorhizobium]MDF3153540.1 hypothetical protein [Mesorhizobium sp. XAP10]MDF3246163.1 hypothetical protein [Mesorhizobium sp. XAP4]